MACTIGLADKKEKVVCPDSVSLGLLIYSRDLEKAERLKIIYDVLMFANGNISFMIRNPNGIERTKSIVESTDFLYQLFIKSNENVNSPAKSKKGTR